MLKGAFPLLHDPGAQVIRAFRMEHDMGGEITGNMGYVLIDRQGIVRAITVNPVFGDDTGKILAAVKSY